MAKIYVCDACDSVIKDPHKLKMKEFYMRPTFEFGNIDFIEDSQKIKIHLCDDCFHALNELAKKKLVGDKRVNDNG